MTTWAEKIKSKQQIKKDPKIGCLLHKLWPSAGESPADKWFLNTVRHAFIKGELTILRSSVGFTDDILTSRFGIDELEVEIQSRAHHFIQIGDDTFTCYDRIIAENSEDILFKTAINHMVNEANCEFAADIWGMRP